MENEPILQAELAKLAQAEILYAKGRPPRCTYTFKHALLEDALYKSIHSLQDDFPVVRGDSLVGIISRQSILSALRNEGNGYVQAVMSRSFHVAQPEDSLGTTISRFAGRGLSLVPVTEGERIVGIVTLQNLMHSMSLLAESRKLRRQSQE